MKAIIFEKGSGLENLVLRDVPKPQPKGNEVLIRNMAASVNAIDYRSMQLGVIPRRKIFGTDVAGIIDEVGEQVEHFHIGDAVLTDVSGAGFGGFAEYTVAPETILAKKPGSVSFEEAAALPMAAVTALQGLREYGKLKTGQQLLICGAGGGVGIFAVQLAKLIGANITAVCGPTNVEMIKALGAEKVIDYSLEDFTKTTSRYDLILGINGNQSLTTYLRLLNPGGCYVMIGGGYSQVFQAVALGRIYSLGSKKIRFCVAKPNAKDLEYVAGLVAAGKLQAVIDRTFSLEQTAEAVKYLKQGHTRGKVIIRVASQ